MKTIVTHLRPDLDACTAVWLIKKYYPGWGNANLEFVAAGKTLNNQPPDIDKNVIHVDTGLGKFDHHQTTKNICAASLVFDFLKKNKYIKNKVELEATEKIVDFVNQIDHFQEVFFPQPESDIYDFCLHQLVEGLKLFQKTDREVVELTAINLEAVQRILKNKIIAEEEIKKGYVFTCSLGKVLAIKSANEETVKIALKKEFAVVIRKDPKKGFIRIKSKPSKKINFQPLYKKLLTIDKKATWYLHPSKNILLNGSAKNPTHIPSQLTLPQIIAIIKEIY